MALTLQPRIRRTATPNTPPVGLQEGELSVEMASNPIRLWVGVPTSIDMSGRRLINSAEGVVGNYVPITGGTVTGTFVVNNAMIAHTTGGLDAYGGLQVVNGNLMVSAGSIGVNGLAGVVNNNGNHVFFNDAAGRGALFLGGSDNVNYYRNATHQFQHHGGAPGTQVNINGALQADNNIVAIGHVIGEQLRVKEAGGAEWAWYSSSPGNIHLWYGTNVYSFNSAGDFAVGGGFSAGSTISSGWDVLVPAAVLIANPAGVPVSGNWHVFVGAADGWLEAPAHIRFGNSRSTGNHTVDAWLYVGGIAVYNDGAGRLYAFTYRAHNFEADSGVAVGGLWITNVSGWVQLHDHARTGNFYAWGNINCDGSVTAGGVMTIGGVQINNNGSGLLWCNEYNCQNIWVNNDVRAPNVYVGGHHTRDNGGWWFVDNLRGGQLHVDGNGTVNVNLVVGNYLQSSGTTYLIGQVDCANNVYIGNYLQVNNEAYVIGVFSTGTTATFSGNQVRIIGENVYTNWDTYTIGGLYAGDSSPNAVARVFGNQRGQQPGITLTDGTGQKPGGGPWDAWSDPRVKQDIGPYTTGLAAIRQLQPINYQYNGYGDTIANGKTYIGLDAKDVQSVMPEMVSEEPMIMPERAPHDAEGHITCRYAEIPTEPMLRLDPNALTYALINAVRELTERLETLERDRHG